MLGGDQFESDCGAGYVGLVDVSQLERLEKGLFGDVDDGS
jgi:hypothetical protein